jgi:hypothetical protein
MWNLLRARLERWGWMAPLHDRLTLSGLVRSPMEEPDHLVEYHPVLLSVRVEGGPGGLHHLDAQGRFRLELPLEGTVTVTITQRGHLPRMVQVRPLRAALHFARPRVHARCEMDVVLTPLFDEQGRSYRPLLERITVPRSPDPLIVEWDQVPRPEPGEEFVPLFLRPV